MNQYETIYEKIKDADLVLIGIGKELSQRKDIEEEQEKEERIHLFNQLYDVIGNKNYFLITTNTDDCIYDSKFEADKIVAPCGSNFRWQCKAACCKDIWDKKIEKCPHCQGEVVQNIWKNQPYVEEGYLKQWSVYTRWLQQTVNKKLVILELGENFETPSVMRWPFEKITYINEKAYFVRVGEKFSQLTEEISNKNRAVSIAMNSKVFIENLKSIVK